jgi:hypothetical protein
MPVSCCAPYVLDVSPYPYSPPPPGYIPPTLEGCANIDSTSHRQPAHPAYYPVYPGYPAVLLYPLSLRAYGPIPTPSGQALPAPPAEQTARNQTVTSDDEGPTAKLLKKKGRAGGEDGGSKSSTKKSKRATNAVSEAPTVVAAMPVTHPSDDSPDDHGSPVAHNTSGGVGGEPLPPVIAPV